LPPAPPALSSHAAAPRPPPLFTSGDTSTLKELHEAPARNLFQALQLRAPPIDIASLYSTKAGSPSVLTLTGTMPKDVAAAVLTFVNANPEHKAALSAQQTSAGACLAPPPPPPLPRASPALCRRRRRRRPSARRLVASTPPPPPAGAGTRKLPGNQLKIERVSDSFVLNDKLNFVKAVGATPLILTEGVDFQRKSYFLVVNRTTATALGLAKKPAAAKTTKLSAASAKTNVRQLKINITKGSDAAVGEAVSLELKPFEAVSWRAIVVAKLRQPLPVVPELEGPPECSGGESDDELEGPLDCSGGESDDEGDM